MQPELEVIIRAFPESNGNQNWTAMLVRKDRTWNGLRGNAGGITIARGEYWNRVAYNAERTKFLIGAVSTEPSIKNYMHDTKEPYDIHIETPERSKAIPVSTSKR